MWCRRHRPGAAAGSTARRKQCGGSSSGALASHKLEPACTCKQIRVRGARAAAQSVRASADACSSGPPQWGLAGVDGRANGARVDLIRGCGHAPARKAKKETVSLNCCLQNAGGGRGKKGVICRASQLAPDEPMTVAKRSQNRPPGRQAGASRVRCADGQVGPKDRGGAPARGQIELKRGATV